MSYATLTAILRIVVVDVDYVNRYGSDVWHGNLNSIGAKGDEYVTCHRTGYEPRRYQFILVRRLLSVFERV